MKKIIKLFGIMMMFSTLCLGCSNGAGSDEPDLTAEEIYENFYNELSKKDSYECPFSFDPPETIGQGVTNPKFFFKLGTKGFYYEVYDGEKFLGGNENDTCIFDKTPFQHLSLTKINSHNIIYDKININKVNNVYYFNCNNTTFTLNFTLTIN